MCWSPEVAAGFTALGIIAASVVWRLTRNRDMTLAILFFCLMEALQAAQYFFIADKLGDAECLSTANRVLTIVGYAHIQFQPYFTNLYLRAFRPSTGKAGPGEASQWVLVQRLCLVQAGLGMLRLCTPKLWDKSLLTPGEAAWYAESKDWLEGPELCTYRGAFHLAWSLPLAQPSYFLGGMGLHSFLMFAPILCVGGFRELDSVAFLAGTGPILAMWLTGNAHEQASIWCFFSTTQCTIGAVSAVLQHRAKQREAPKPAKGKK